MKGQLLRYPEPGWAPAAYAAVLPGAHVLCFGKNPHALEAEEAGFEVRDAIEVIGPVRHRVWLLRRPIQEKNVVSQVLKTGTGALWIDGCRIASVEKNPTISRRETARRTGHAPVHNRSAAEATADGRIERRGSPEVFMENRPSEALGRWPPNLLLVHTPGCERAGTRRVKNVGGSTSGETALGQGSGWNPHENRPTGIARPRDEDGLETIDAWACGPGCPVAALDAQSGDRPSTLTGRADPGAAHEHPSDAQTNSWFHRGLAKGSHVYADAGGASRFFPQFANEGELDAWLLRLIFGPRNT